MRGGLHASHKHDRDQRKLGLVVHLKLHDEYNREYRKRKVADDAKSTVYVGEGDDDVDVDAASVLVLVPEKGNGVALERGDEQEANARDDTERHDDEDDPVVNLLDGDAEKEVSDGDFGENHGDAVPDVAEVPVLCDRLDSCLRHAGP